MFEVEKVLAGWTWINSVASILSSHVPGPPECDINIKLRATGEVVDSTRHPAGIVADAALQEIQSDLEMLDRDAFCEKYAIQVSS